MATLQELQKQNKDLRNQLVSKREIEQIGRDRIKLLEQNKKLIRNLKGKPSTGTARRTLGVIGRGFFKGGKTIGKGVIAYGRFLEKQEQRSRQRVKTLKKISRPKRRR